MKVTVLVHDAEPDEGGYWAEVLEMPGCLSQGETLDEVDHNIREAIDLWLDMGGQPIEAPEAVDSAPGLRAWRIFVEVPAAA